MHKCQKEGCQKEFRKKSKLERHFLSHSNEVIYFQRENKKQVRII